MVHATPTAAREHGRDHGEVAADELVLRICSPLRRGQIVRLRSRKCSIGSAQNCTLRLAARGVHPVHCLIVRGENEAVVRCWAPDTRLNGRAFSDANLNVGDRLTVGPVEFEVLQTSVPVVPPAAAVAAEDDREAQLSEQESDFQQQKQQFSEQMATQRAELDQQRQSLQQQQTELGEQAESLQQERSEFSEQAESLQQQRKELSQESESLQQHRDELAQESESLQRQRQEWEALRHQEAAQTAEHEERIRRLQEQLATQRAELDQQRQSLQRQQTELGKQTESLQQQRSEISEQTESLQQQRDELAQEAESLRRQRSELNDLAASLQQHQSEPVPQVNVDESRQPAISSEAPVSLGSVLGKMGLDQAFAEDQPGRAAASASASGERTPAAAAAEPTAAPAGNSSTEDDQDDEKWLESYITSLMERVRGIDHPPAAPETDAVGELQHGAADHDQQTAAESASVHSHPRSATEPPAASAAKGSAGEPRDFSPRGAVPEKAERLSALREIANVSAKTAIERHAKRQFLHAARSKLLVAAVGLLASGFILYFWWFAGQRGPIFYAGLIAFMVALFWGFQFATISGKVTATKASGRQSPSAGSTTPDEEISHG